jgi:hypothetical protein
MQPLTLDDEGDWVPGDRVWMTQGGKPSLPQGAIPDLFDPATLGCLLALVREAWSDPGVSVWYDRRVGLWAWMANGCAHSVHRPSDEDGYDTEAEALVAALEAAE